MKGRHIARHRLQPKRAQRAEAQSGSCRPTWPPPPATGGRVALPLDTGHHQSLVQSHSPLPPVWGPLPTRQEERQFERKTKAHLFLSTASRQHFGFCNQKEKKKKKILNCFSNVLGLGKPQNAFCQNAFSLNF